MDSMKGAIDGIPNGEIDFDFQRSSQNDNDVSYYLA